MLRHGGWRRQRQRRRGRQPPDAQIVAKAMDCAGAAHGNGTNLLYQADAEGDDLKAKYG